MSRSKQVIADAGFYSAAVVLTQLITIVAAVVMRRFLGPAQVGVWALMQLVLTYADYSQLGTMNAIIREIPYYRGKGDEAKAESIKNTVFTFSLLSALLCSLGVMVYAVVLKNSLSVEIFWGLCLTALLILLQRMNGLLTTLIRSLKRFDVASRQLVYSAIVNTTLVAVLSYRFRFYGFMAAMCLSFTFNFVYLCRRQSFQFRPVLELKELRSLISYGFPFMLMTLMGTLFDTIDRVMISRYIDLEALGLYSIALMTSTYIYSIPNAVSVVLVPNLHEIYGKNDDPNDLRNFLFKSDLAFTTLIPVFIGLAWFAMPLVVKVLLPQFIAGIEPMRFLVLGVFYLAVGQAYMQFIYVIKKEMNLLWLTGGACVLAAALIGVSIRQGAGLSGVAMATAMAVFIHYLSLYWYAAPKVLPIGLCLRHHVTTLLKFIWMCALLFSVDHWVRISGDLQTALLQIGVFVIAYIPFFLKLNSEFGLTGVLKERFFKKAVAL